MTRGGDPFEVYIRREPGYELRLTVRYEVSDGHGILALPRPGRRETAPATVYEEREIEAAVLRAGRFIHVQQGSSRRQSYAMSRLLEDTLHLVSDERWTQLDAITEYGFRYLVVPEEALNAAPAEAAASVVAPSGSSSPAPARVALPAARVATPAPAPTVNPSVRAAVAAVPAAATARPATAPAASAGRAAVPRRAAGGTPPSALQLAMSALKDGVEPQSMDAARVTRATPPPGPTRIPLPRDPVAAPAPAAADPSLATLRGLPPADLLAAAEAQARTIAELRTQIAELERLHADGVAREGDLLEILGRWQQRELRR